MNGNLRPRQKQVLGDERYKGEYISDAPWIYDAEQNRGKMMTTAGSWGSMGGGRGIEGAEGNCRTGRRATKPRRHVQEPREVSHRVCHRPLGEKIIEDTQHTSIYESKQRFEKPRK